MLASEAYSGGDLVTIHGKESVYKSIRCLVVESLSGHFKSRGCAGRYAVPLFSVSSVSDG